MTKVVIECLYCGNKITKQVWYNSSAKDTCAICKETKLLRVYEETGATDAYGYRFDPKFEEVKKDDFIIYD